MPVKHRILWGVALASVAVGGHSSVAWLLPANAGAALQTAPCQRAMEGDSDLQGALVRAGQLAARLGMEVSTRPELGTGSRALEVSALADGDEEWASLPRLADDMMLKLKTAPQALAATDLFRSLQLNPRDKYIGVEHRKALTAAVRSYRELALEVSALMQSTRAKEMDVLIGAGLATRLAPRIQEGRAGFDFLDPGDAVVSIRGGSDGLPCADSVPKDVLRFSNEIEQMLEFMGQEMGGRIIDFFSRQNAITYFEGKELLDRLFRPRQGH